MKFRCTNVTNDRMINKSSNDFICIKNEAIILQNRFTCTYASYMHIISCDDDR